MGKIGPNGLCYSQNFLTSARTIGRLLALTDLGPCDHVLEIGPGRGHVTGQLLARCGHATAVELDGALCQRLTEKFAGAGNLTLIHGDFLRQPLPTGAYKVFANIPFSRTTDIIHRLTECGNPPREMWLILEKGAAMRFLGLPRENLSSLRLKPYFTGEILCPIDRTEFHPSPSVPVVLLHLTRRADPDLMPGERQAWAAFLSACFTGQLKGLTRKLTVAQIRRVLGGMPFAWSAPSGVLRYVQWLCLFRCSRTARPD